MKLVLPRAACACREDPSTYIHELATQNHALLPREIMSYRYRPFQCIFVILILFTCLTISTETVLAQDTAASTNKIVTGNLTREQSDQATRNLIAEWKIREGQALKHNLLDLIIRHGDLSLPLFITVYGDEPKDGHSIWISMHGGGETFPEENDSQWENQKSLYKPQEGIYVAPRAPWNTWDLWFKAPIDSMFEELIRTLVTVLNANPNKVYLMGYSAGGDGAWRLAPRMADHWAAASMMAGHPGDVGLENLRNTPFSMWVGENDIDFNRNTEVPKRGAEMDRLQKKAKDGYIHETHVVAGKPHWMGGADQAAVPWMAQYTRNPYPKHVFWKQEEVTRPMFYWLEAPANELKRGMTVTANIDKNTITINQCDYSTITLWLNDSLVDLNKDVTVKLAGKQIFKGKVERNIKNLQDSLEKRGDPAYVFPAKLELSCKVSKPTSANTQADKTEVLVF